LIYLNDKTTGIRYSLIELLLIFQELEQLLNKLIMPQEIIQNSLCVLDLGGGFGLIGELDESKDLEIVGDLGLLEFDE
jgi:hypothetical protein